MENIGLGTVSLNPKQNISNKEEIKSKTINHKSYLDGVRVGLLDTLDSTIKKITYGVTERKNKKAVPWSKENLEKLINDKIPYVQYGKYFRLYKSTNNENTLVFDITRNLDDLQDGSKRNVLENKIVQGLKSLVEELKTDTLKSIIGKYRYIELTSRIFGSKNLTKDGNPKLRNVFVENIAKEIPEIDLEKTKAMKMSFVDFIGTMGVYPHHFQKIWKYASKGQMIIDLNKKTSKFGN